MRLRTLPFASVETDVPQMVSTFLLSYPLASLHTRIPRTSPNLAHLYNIAVSVFFIWPFLGMRTGMAHLMLDIGVTYGLVVGSRNKRMPWIVFGYVPSLSSPSRR
jgi:lysophospholipid acyltransferase